MNRCQKRRNTYITGQGILQFSDGVSCSARGRTRRQAEVRVLKNQNTQHSNPGPRAPICFSWLMTLASIMTLETNDCPPVSLAGREQKRHFSAPSSRQPPEAHKGLDGHDFVPHLCYRPSWSLGQYFQEDIITSLPRYLEYLVCVSNEI